MCFWVYKRCNRVSLPSDAVNILGFEDIINAENNFKIIESCITKLYKYFWREVNFGYQRETWLTFVLNSLGFEWIIGC